MVYKLTFLFPMGPPNRGEPIPTYIYIYLFIYLFKYVQIYIYVCVYICMCIYLYIYMFLFTFIYIEICIYLFTYRAIGEPILFASVPKSTNCTMRCCRLAASTTYIYRFKSTKTSRYPRWWEKHPVPRYFPVQITIFITPMRVGIAHDLPTHQTQIG